MMNDVLKDTASHKREPQEYDLVLGGNNPPPVDGVVLGGIEGVTSRLASDNIQSQISALSEALNYSEAGLDLVIEALSNYRREIRQNAYRLLQQKEDKKAKEAVSNYKFWSDFEYLNGCPFEHAKTFAHRKVEVYDPNIGIIDPANTAYFIKQATYGDFLKQSPDGKGFKNIETFRDKFNKFTQDLSIGNLEAFIGGYGFWNLNSSYEPDSLIANLFDICAKIPNLKALFIGDIEDREMMISDIPQSDLSPILAVYPHLEFLHLRGGKRLQFSPGYLDKHNNLKVIRIESGGLPREAINGLCALDLPALEYLELWMGTPEYGGNSTIEDLMPIITGEAFPNLKYLGLRNAEYTDEIALEIVKSPLIERLIELDLSLGTLGIEGGEALSNCSAVNELDTLNVSYNWLVRNCHYAPKLLTLDCELIAEGQKAYNPDPDSSYYHHHRYCRVRE